MADDANKSNSSLDTGTKVVIGLASVALLFALLDGGPDNDAWQGDETATVKESGTGADADADAVDIDVDDEDDGEPVAPADDPWTRGGPPDADDSLFDDDEPEPPVDDPWTRGGPPDADDSLFDDDEPEAPVDDPWTRGNPDDSAGDGLPACVATMDYETDDGRVRLPTDRPEDEWASADCTFSRGQSGDPVELVQVALNLCNGQRFPIDGENGDATRAALSNVQAAHGIAVDGGYGPATREVMAWPTDPDDGRSPLCVPQPDIG
ncbi:MAG TPA: peptidoglycan-binding domain-containing protein [Acidimicrobiales bacterium]|nr:peptidoglycan-binding domain-containing protein [Acidimicrobiales bacterium]